MNNQEAIKWVRAIMATQNQSIHKASCDDRIEALLMGIQALEEQDKHRWIPVSERLPENEVEVQVCTRRNYQGKYHYLVTSGHYQDGTMHTENSKWCWYDCNFEYCEETDDWIIDKGWWEERHYNPDDVYNNLIDDEVVAWMPLPEPYKKEVEE